MPAQVVFPHTLATLTVFSSLLPPPPTPVLSPLSAALQTDKKACVLAGARLELKQKGLKLRRADGGAAASPPRDAVGAVPPAPGKITIRSGDRVRFERGCAPGASLRPSPRLSALTAPPFREEDGSPAS